MSDNLTTLVCFTSAGLSAAIIVVAYVVGGIKARNHELTKLQMVHDHELALIEAKRTQYDPTPSTSSFLSAISKERGRPLS